VVDKLLRENNQLNPNDFLLEFSIFSARQAIIILLSSIAHYKFNRINNNSQLWIFDIELGIKTIKRVLSVFINRPGKLYWEN